MNPYSAERDRAEMAQVIHNSFLEMEGGEEFPLGEPNSGDRQLAFDLQRNGFGRLPILSAGYSDALLREAAERLGHLPAESNLATCMRRLVAEIHRLREVAESDPEPKIRVREDEHGIRVEGSLVDVSAGGWCAPYEVMFPEIAARRGGISFTTGPDFDVMMKGRSLKQQRKLKRQARARRIRRRVLIEGALRAEGVRNAAFLAKKIERALR